MHSVTLIKLLILRPGLDDRSQGTDLISIGAPLNPFLLTLAAANRHFATLALLSSSVALAAGHEPPRAACDQRGEDPPYTCLPERVSNHFPTDPDFIRVAGADEPAPLVDLMPEEDPSVTIPLGFRSRIGTFDWHHDDARPLLIAAFPQEEFVRLPRGARIIEHRGPVQVPSIPGIPSPIREATVWTYPVGIEIAHRVYAKRAASRPLLLEIRILRLLPSGRWAGAVYAPDPKSPKRLLLRRRVPGPVELEVEVPGGPSGTQTLNASFLPVGVQSCRECHYMHGSAGRQAGVGLPAEQRMQFAGPCGFTSEMDAERKDAWARAFRRRFGYAPIEQR